MTKVVLHSTLVAVSITLAFLPAPSEAIAPALLLSSFSGMGCKECMVLVPATVAALGMGMLKPMIPQLRQARAEMRALSPAEQRSAISDQRCWSTLTPASFRRAWWPAQGRLSAVSSRAEPCLRRTAAS